MASPHVTGVAALIIEGTGVGEEVRPRSLTWSVRFSRRRPPTTPARRGDRGYTDEGRPADFNAVCDGTTAENGLYGEGIVDALAAVQ